MGDKTTNDTSVFRFPLKLAPIQAQTDAETSECAIGIGIFLSVLLLVSKHPLTYPNSSGRQVT